MVVELISPSDVIAARALIESSGLRFELPYDELLGLFENEKLVAVAARAGSVLKMFAIAPGYQGGEVLGSLATALLHRGFAAENQNFFLFTKPSYATTFEQLNFKRLVSSASITVLEYGGGFARYLREHQTLTGPGDHGAVVLNANPFTLGHRFLVETASQRNALLYVFVVREDRSVFPFEARMQMVREGTADLPNVRVLDTSRYIVSSLTFPAYFLNKGEDVEGHQLEIDVRLFAEKLAPAFGIRTRYVGHEPYCTTTRRYNETMARLLPEYDIDFVEIERKLQPGTSQYLSATRVREAFLRGDNATWNAMVPPSTQAVLQSQYGRAVRDRALASEFKGAKLPSLGAE